MLGVAMSSPPQRGLSELEIQNSSIKIFHQIFEILRYQQSLLNHLSGQINRASKEMLEVSKSLESASQAIAYEFRDQQTLYAHELELLNQSLDKHNEILKRVGVAASEPPGALTMAAGVPKNVYPGSSTVAHHSTHSPDYEKPQFRHDAQLVAELVRCFNDVAAQESQHQRLSANWIRDELSAALSNHTIQVFSSPTNPPYWEIHLDSQSKVYIFPPFTNGFGRGVPHLVSFFEIEPSLPPGYPRAEVLSPAQVDRANLRYPPAESAVQKGKIRVKSS